MTKTFGIEIELGVVNKNLEKPTEPDFLKAFTAFKKYKTEKIMKRQIFFGKLSRRDKNDLKTIQALSKILNSSGKKSLQEKYEKFLRLDNEELFGKIVELNKKMNQNFLFSKSIFDFLKKTPLGLISLNKSFAQFDEMLCEKLLLEMAFFRILPLFDCLSKRLNNEQLKHIKYDESDSIEFASEPHTNLNDIEKELLNNIELIEKTLEKKKAYLFFGGNYPKTKRIGLFEKIGIGEDQDFLGLHVHIGGFSNKVEMAEYYNKLIDFFEKNPNLIEKERKNYYRLQNPDKIDCNDTGLENKLKIMFGKKDSKFERSERPDVNKIISMLNNQKSRTLIRDYSTIFIRPEYGTIEIRAFGTKGNGRNNTKENLNKNIVFVKKFLKNTS